VPAPSPALAALLDGLEEPATSRDPDRTRGFAVAAVALLLAMVGTGWAAAANELPAPLQDAIADFSQHHLPFDLPHSTNSDGDDDPGPGVVKFGLPGDRSVSRGYRIRTVADLDDVLADRRAEEPVGSTTGSAMDESLVEAGSPLPPADDAVTGSPASEPGATGDEPEGSGGQGDDQGDDQGGSQSGNQSGNPGTHPGGGAGGNTGSNPGGAPDEIPGDNADENADENADDNADLGRPSLDDPSSERRPDRPDPRADIPQAGGTPVRP
jgi:hypothetical protein